MEILLFAYPDCLALDLVGPSDVFVTASQLVGERLYEPVLVGTEAGQVIVTESGIQLVAQRSLYSRALSAHTLLVGGGNGFRAAMHDRKLIGGLSAAGQNVDRVTSVCTGAFLLAEAGLLEGHRATTHWVAAAELGERYPGIDVVPDEIHVTSGRTMTSAGVTAGIDLALAMVAADHGDDLARAVARRMVVYLNRSGGQSQFSERLEVGEGGDPGVDAAVAAVLADPCGSHSVANLAALAQMSERNFSRKFKAMTGTTPGRWVERVRIDVAREALEQTNDPPRAIAVQAGFGSYDTMRRAFERVLGVSPARYRHTH